MLRVYTLRLLESVLIGGIAFEAFSVVHSIRAPPVGNRVSAERVKVFYVPDVVSISARSNALRGISVSVGDGASVTRNIVRRERTTGTLFGTRLSTASSNGVATNGCRR